MTVKKKNPQTPSRRGRKPIGSTWTTAEGATIPVSQLTDSHLLNIQRKLTRCIANARFAEKALGPIKKELRSRGLS